MPFRTNRTTAPMRSGMPRPSTEVAQQLQLRQQQQMANRVQRTRPVANPNQFAPQPQFNLPNPVQGQMAPSQPGSFFQPPVSPQNPVGGFQTPPQAPTPIVSDGNFGTIQPQPAPISDVAMPTPNPVPMPQPQPQPGPGMGLPPGVSIGFGPAPIDPGMMMPGSMGDQVTQQQGGMNALPGLGGGLPPGVSMWGGPAELQFDQFGNPLPT